MIKQYQITLLCKDKKYKPVSCIVNNEAIELNNKEQKKEVIQKGVLKICVKRNWTKKELEKYNYSIIKIREYNKEKIEEENRIKYEAIKEAHYADGSWKRPKEK